MEFDLETIITIIIIILAGIYVGIKLYRTAKGKDRCSCEGKCSLKIDEK